jgi:hypothetical protein
MTDQLVYKRAIKCYCCGIIVIEETHRPPTMSDHAWEMKKALCRLEPEFCPFCRLRRN